MLLPIEIGHQYRTGKQSRVPWTPLGRPTEEEEVAILWNRWKMIEMLPLPVRIAKWLHDELRTHSRPQR